MPVRVGCGLSTLNDPQLGAIDAAEIALEQLGTESVDLVVVFVSGSHLAAPDVALDAVHGILDPDAVIGCGGAGVVGRGREIEHGTAISVWAANLGHGTATPFHADVRPADGGVTVSGLPDMSGAAGAVLLPDPYTFPTDSILDELAVRAPGVPLLGGVSSARTLDGEGALMCDETVHGGGAVGVRFDDVNLLPCVSQGARPVGPELEITAGDGHVIHELAGEPALPKLRDVVESLPESDRAAVAEGVLLGIVLGDAAGTGASDVLIRGLLGGDPSHGTVAVGAPVIEGQIVRLHARDAATADRDLRDALELRRIALGDDSPSGALVFTCTGRGREMFGTDDHDAIAVRDGLAGAPAAGFFAAGEIGPVGGGNFLHGFTATVAVFA
ncbi:MAG: FIST C-terminal domain-containing protein [Solirubrobacteraceae bacterium]|nr:FIST C-terminal domain-containing protein [Solirubrobacteraceae bacterium]